MRRILLCWVSLWFLMITGSPPALAHAALLASTPRDGQIVQTSPGEITMEFSEPLEEGLFNLKLFDGNGRQIALAKPQLAAGDAAQMRAKLPALPNGTYTVAWSVVSEDGHPVSGSFSFSVGRTVSKGTVPVSEQVSPFINRALAAIRYVVEGTLLLGAGLHWLSWFGQRRGWPAGTQVSGRWRRAGWLVLFAGLVAEGLLYLASLPGNGLVTVFFEGHWTILGQSPFLGMVGAQLALMLLIAVPGMVEGWYLAIWAVAVGTLAFGGHTWGIQPVWLAAAFRILHLYSLSLWLGALTCLLLALRRERTSGVTIDWGTFRRFFVRLALLASGTALLSGVAMTVQQTDWASLWTNRQTWSILLGLKVLLIIAMLLLALIQTLRWRKHGRLLSPALLRWEWGAGVLALLAGVWMSQSAYPLPVTAYTQTFVTRDAHVAVHIPRVAPGTQIMTIEVHSPPGTEPKQVLVQITKPDATVNREPIPAKQTEPGHYQALIPFSMYGTWTYRIDVAFTNDTHVTGNDTLFIPGGETR